jgi:hypothetical protein
VITRIDDPVVLAQQLSARIFRDAAKRFVYVVDDAALIGYRNYCGLIEGDSENRKFVERSLNVICCRAVLAWFA